MPESDMSLNNSVHNLGFLDESKLKKIERSCDFCKESRSRLVHRVTFVNHEFCFVQCQNCGLIYQNPRLDQESLSHIYETVEYWEHKNIGRNDIPMLNYCSYAADSHDRRENAQHRCQLIKKYVPLKASVLDLACADGLFVHALSQAGYRASGLDISASMIERARKAYGVDVYKANFEDDWPFGQVDAVTCFATLNNFFQPSLVFQNISNHLKPEGYLFFNFSDVTRLIPRLLNRARFLCRPSCGTMYSFKTVKKYLERYGFVIEKIMNDNQMMSFSRIFGFMGFNSAVKTIESLGLDHASVHLPWPTGYIVCARRV